MLVFGSPRITVGQAKCGRIDFEKIYAEDPEFEDVADRLQP